MSTITALKSLFNYDASKLTFRLNKSRGVKTGSSNKPDDTLVRFCLLRLITYFYPLLLNMTVEVIIK